MRVESQVTANLTIKKVSQKSSFSEQYNNENKSVKK